MNNRINTHLRTVAPLRRALAGLLVAALCCLTFVAPASAAEGVVNINEAPAETLQNLPRVGPAVASRIEVSSIQPSSSLSRITVATRGMASG